MITLTESWWVWASLFVCALRCVWLDLRQCWKAVRGGLLRWRQAKGARRSEALKPYLGKLVREVKTGRVGFCMGVGTMNTLRAELGLEVCFCPGCVKAMTAANEAGDPLGAFKATMIARATGHTTALVASAITIAPASDAVAFRAEMEKATGESEP